jgi:hypothetical protein
MITTTLFRVFSTSDPSLTYAPATPDHVRRFLDQQRQLGKADQWGQRLAEYCHCCGHHWDIGPGEVRCFRHHGRNPCAIEGCRRSRVAPLANGRYHHADDQWLCSQHWRMFVPPRSRARRTYHAYFRKAKRYGWDDDLERRFWRYWRKLVRRARKASEEGSLDEREINRLMGWE